MKAEFLPLAEEEFENPYAAAAVGTGVRRKVLNHFPYSLVYAVEAGFVVILAVAHQKRRPKYWIGRVKELSERPDRTKE